jgi:hypothetical protein
MKNRKKSLLLLWISCYAFAVVSAQDSTGFTIVNQNWTFNQNNIGGNSSRIYYLIFQEGGTGLLRVNLGFLLDDVEKLNFGARAFFTYEVMENTDLPEGEWIVNVVYGDFSFKASEQYVNNEDARRNRPDYDQGLLDEMAQSFSNQEVTYHLKRQSNYLVLEGFVQNEESGYTYFVTDPSQIRNN